MKRFTTTIQSLFSTITHLRGKPQLVNTKNVKLRGIHLQSTTPDSPTLIFFPEIFDQAENWLAFFSDPLNKIIQQRNIYILYPRNFGNSDHTNDFTWEDTANDVARFMYEQKISMATLGGHGIGAKIALAAACYHFEHVTGFFGLSSTPTNQYYHQATSQLRNYVNSLKDFNIQRPFAAINNDIKTMILCPKWRNIFLNCLEKVETGYQWNFNLNTVHHNLIRQSPSNLTCWHSSIGLYPGRSMFAFPEYSRFVHMSTNTLPMYSICPRLQGFNEDIFGIQGDDNPLSSYGLSKEATNPFAFRINEFLKHYDGVNVLLRNRDEVGNHYIPDLNKARVQPDDYAGAVSPAHYHHNWRFNGVYQK